MGERRFRAVATAGATGCIRTHTHAYTGTHTHTYTGLHTHTRTHARKRTLVNTHTHTHARVELGRRRRSRIAREFSLCVPPASFATTAAAAVHPSAVRAFFERQFISRLVRRFRRRANILFRFIYLFYFLLFIIYCSQSVPVSKDSFGTVFYDFFFSLSFRRTR